MPVEVAAYANVVVAEMVKARLEDEGIQAFLTDANTATSLAGVEAVLGGVRVLVASEDEAAARDVLANLSYPLGTGAPANLEEDLEEQAEASRESAARRFLMLMAWSLIAVVAVGLLVAGIGSVLRPREQERDDGLPSPPDPPRQLPAPLR